MGTWGGVIFPLLLAFSTLNAQNTLFTEVNPSSVSLTTVEGLRLQRVSTTAYSHDTRMITMADVRTVQQQGILTFQLPDNPTQVLTAKAAPLSYYPTDGFEWTGNLVSGGQGYAMFTIADGKKSGIVVVDGVFYEIIPLSDNYQAVVRKNVLDNETCGLLSPSNITTDPDPDPPGGECTPTDNNNNCPAVVEVLIVVEPEAAQEIIDIYGSIRTFLHPSDNSINLAFANSDIPNKTVHTQWIVDNEIDFLFSELDIDMPLIADYFVGANYREQFGADIVVLLTTNRYSPYYGRVVEIGPVSSSAFAIVEYPAFYSSMIFAHELGHLFGARHEWGQDDTEVCAHGKFNVDVFPPIVPNNPSTGSTWRTIVTTISEGGGTIQFPDPAHPGSNITLFNQGPIPYFSNPDITYNGDNTGREDINNAEQIRNAGCTVAGFTPAQSLRIGMYSASGCTSTTIRTTVFTPPAGSGGQPPYAYTWHWSANGVFDQSILASNYLGTTTWPALQITPPDCKFFYIRCMVTALDGTTVINILPVDLNDLDCPCVEFISGTNAIDGTGTYSLSPNPATNTLVLGGSTVGGQPVHYTIRNISGQVVGQGNTMVGQTISVEKLAQGTYFLDLTDEKSTQPLKFIKIQHHEKFPSTLAFCHHPIVRTRCLQKG